VQATSATITISLTIATTLEEFDATAQDAFKASLALQLDGISPNDVTLQVSAASVSVVATISAPTEAIGEAAVGKLKSLAASPDDLTAALGVKVVTVDAAPAMIVERPGLAQRIAQSFDDIGGTTVIIGVVGGLIVLLIPLAVLSWRRRSALERRLKRLFKPEVVDGQTIQLDVVSASSCHMAAAISSTSCTCEDVDEQTIKIDIVESAMCPESGSSNAKNGAGSGLATTREYSSVSSTSSGGRSGAQLPSARKQRALQAMTHWEWSSDKIVWMEELGAGSFGVVHRIVHERETFAAKRMDLNARRQDRTELEGKVTREFRALERVSHPKIIQLLGVVRDHPEWICLIMELANQGSLRQMLDRKPDVIIGKVPVQISLVHDIASGLAFCHSMEPQPVLHHDIKSANVLLFSHDELGRARLTAKVGDFGLAVGLSGTSTAAATSRTKTHAGGGTLAYRAPETFSGKYTTASEVFSFGVVVYEVLTALIPWNRDAEGKPYMEANVIHFVVHKGKRPELPSNVNSLSKVLVALMRRCWNQAPKRRPSFASIVTQLTPQLPHRSSSSENMAEAMGEIRSISQSVSELHELVEAVDQNVQSGVSTIVAKLDAAEERLARELHEGNADVLKQIQLLHSSLLPEIQCVVAQQTLELLTMRQASNDGGGTGGGVMDWLFSSKQEEGDRLAEAQHSVAAAIDMANAKLRASAAANVASAAAASDTASTQILAKLGEMQTALVDKSAESATGEMMLSKLAEMSSFLAQMDGRMTEMRLDADEHAKVQARRMAVVHAKLDALLTGSHEQVFHYFVLVPKPYKGYMGRAIDKLRPRHWFAKPMLLIPLYRAANGELKSAPVSLANGGFEVPKPLDFVKKHPRVVQVAMLVLKAGIKLGAAQLGVPIPAQSLEALSSVTDALVNDTLQLAIEASAADAASQDEAESSDAAQALRERDSRKSINEFMANEAATAPPEDVLETLSRSDEYKAASRNEYALLKGWLDRLHPGWESRCGLEARVDQESGHVEWLPPDAEAIEQQKRWLKHQERGAPTSVAEDVGLAMWGRRQ
jgi:serine/threonine protein kinase